MASDWIEDIPALRRLDEPTKAQLRDSAVRKQLPRGAVLFRPGDQCVLFPLIVAGTVRVQRVTESGREIVLYRVSTNETCILTTASLLSDDAYAAEGIAETDVTAYIVPAERFASLMNVSADFRALVFDGYSRRIATLMSRIEEIVCTRINVRLAERLLSLRGNDNRIFVTQQALAADLGTAREVVGRTLKSFERSGWVKLSRGGAEITDAAALRALCDAERD
ncbi:Crp/Fnr family transcriptional regulator [Methylocystis parvus]|uniref:Crp/Fnr family transcriptional regulator n=1 Tax=Methylocystis parvus TaxID=134 RepID=A0A6B8M4W3_9HYPH|nr:Crp/Fnr family transcriptional regulator [Methylocystis parvus]QGM97172.1 Crp/Fnr family transcriptional regulator [Methylocystis parvus]WBJ98924.1 Crp/Fnr family transcriptional regulator [Methylocystis parvus OBBP]